MQHGLHFTFFGQTNIHQDDAPVTELTSRKSQALLYYLVVTGVPHSRSSLAGLLWADMPENDARMNLRQALTTLRRVVGDYLIINRQTVAFNRNSNYHVDVETFVANTSNLLEADINVVTKGAELYQGDFLANFDIKGCPLFETWMLNQRAYLQTLALQTLHHLAGYYVDHHDYPRAIDYATRLLHLEPWREETHRQLMRLLAYNGQRGAALSQYEQCRRILAEELDVEPAPETTTLYEQIRDGAVKQPTDEFPTFVKMPDFLTKPISIPVVDNFVAREDELSQFKQRLELVVSGEGQMVFVTGEAGSGKTALVHRVIQQARRQYPTLLWAKGNCNAYGGVGDPYLPFREVLEMLTGDMEAQWMSGTIDSAYAHRLWQLLPETTKLLTKTGPNLLDIFIAGTALLERVSVAAPADATWLIELQTLIEQQKQRQGPSSLRQGDLFAQYTKMIHALARRQPLVIVFDDLQWADAGSLSLLFHLGRRLKGFPILLVGIYRPDEVTLRPDGERHPLLSLLNEFQREFGEFQIDLQQTKNQAFVDAVLDSESHRFSASFRQALYQQTQGHALFTVEVLRSMQARGDVVRNEDGYWVEGREIDWERVPARVEGVIQERLGRLPDDLLDVLRIASVQGETFNAGVIAEIKGIDERKLLQQLGTILDQRYHLVRSHGSKRLGSRRVSLYRFQHSLFQKYLYSNLDEGERIYLHEAVGNSLEQIYANNEGEIAVQLALHFQVAEIIEKAIRYLHQAGQRALRLSANEEAITHLKQGIDLLQTAPVSMIRYEQEIGLYTTLLPAYQSSKGYGAPEVKETGDHILTLCQHLGETPQLFSVFPSLLIFYMMRGEHDTTSSIAEQALQLAHRLEDTDILASAHNVAGLPHLLQGEFKQAQHHFEQYLALVSPDRPGSELFLTGHDLTANGLTQLAFALWSLGYPEQAEQRIQEALHQAETLNHPFTLAYTLVLSAHFYQFSGRDITEVLTLAQKAITLSCEHKFPFWFAEGMLFQGWVLVHQDQPEQGIADMRQGLGIRDEAGVQFLTPYYQGLFAEAYGIVGQAEDGVALVSEAITTIHKTGERIWEAQLWLLKGDLLQKLGHPSEEVEAAYQEALTLSQHQAIKMFELRALIPLSQIWYQQGQTQMAREQLQSLYDWFDEGFETRYLKQAKTLLTAWEQT